VDYAVLILYFAFVLGIGTLLALASRRSTTYDNGDLAFGKM
jgi:hypothetical protein